MTMKFLRFMGCVTGILLGYCITAAVAQQTDLEKAVASADVKAGERFALRCKACHTLDNGGANRLGPNLWAIVSRKQSSAKGYKYSPALSKLTGVWTLAELDVFLADPRKYAPGNRMAFPGIKSERQRYQLLTYLKTLSDEPAQPKQIAKPPAATARGMLAEPSFADELELPQGAGREEVAALCAACHSMAIVRQQGLDRDRWDELMSWMTNTQGMPALLGEQRKLVVDYLAQNYGPQSRRQQTNPMNHMMPRLPAMPLPAPPPK